MDRIGRYEIIEAVGSGGAGRVYRANDPLLDRVVAIFVFPAGQRHSFGERKLARFSSHPCIVDIYDVGEHDGQRYHVLEFIDGRSVAQLIDAGVRITTDAALSMAEAIAGALQYMHSGGIQHNDVTPENVILRRTGEPVLVDFRSAGELQNRGSIGAADIRGLASTLTAALTGDLAGASDDLAEVAPTYVVELVRRCHEGAFCDADALARSLHTVVEALAQSDSPTTRFEPREGDTVLVHADNRDTDCPGSYREYHIEQHLSAGGFGNVYCAVDRVTGKRVALKVLKGHLLTDADAVARFRREADVLTYLQHPNIVRIFNYGRYGASVFIAMELIDGKTLAAIGREHGPMDVDRAAGYVTPILRALDVLSKAGVVHRDVKPTNVKVADGRVVLLDFGIARVEGWEPLTEDAAFIGTVRYAAPEQVGGGRITPATDVYAAGVVLYELLTRVTPHGTGKVTQMLIRIATEAPPPIEAHRKDLPPAIVSLVSDMLALDPSARPTAAEAARMLAGFDREAETISTR
jgi:serine/threonine protein kinase